MLKLYSSFFQKFLGPFLSSHLISKQRWGAGAPRNFPKKKNQNVDTRIWFHAASVGELEALTPVVERFESLLQSSTEPKKELIVTIFSPSAKKTLDQMSVPTLYRGFSPLEGQWEMALERVKPDLFITSKYEAWPELWASLARKKIPLLVVGARAGSTLKWAKKFSYLLTGELPKVSFLTFEAEEKKKLARLFPQASIRLCSDPRWERVHQRVEREREAIDAWVKPFQDLPRPWGILGSAWPKDLQALLAALRGFQGTLWVVPHTLAEESLKRLESLLDQSGWACFRTSSSQGARVPGGAARGSAVLVNEMGRLTALYQKMDWAMVGGGFQSQVHSTIEPGLAGIPTLIGPGGEEKFPEIQFLEKISLLTVAHESEDLTVWVAQNSQGATDAARLSWSKEVRKKLGGAQQVQQEIQALLHTNS
jgi:3-deoxy-D-manno-octulosonic-acid transferase